MQYETHAPIGELVRQARTLMHYPQQEFATLAGINVKTLRSVETSDNAPQDNTRFAIEQALGWRTGIMRELWENRNTTDFSHLTPEDLREGQATRATRASDLTDEELTSELAFRLRIRKESHR